MQINTMPKSTRHEHGAPISPALEKSGLRSISETATINSGWAVMDTSPTDEENYTLPKNQPWLEPTRPVLCNPSAGETIDPKTGGCTGGD